MEPRDLLIGSFKFKITLFFFFFFFFCESPYLAPNIYKSVISGCLLFNVVKYTISVEQFLEESRSQNVSVEILQGTENGINV